MEGVKGYLLWNMVIVLPQTSHIPSFTDFCHLMSDTLYPFSLYRSLASFERVYNDWMVSSYALRLREIIVEKVTDWNVQLYHISALREGEIHSHRVFRFSWLCSGTSRLVDAACEICVCREMWTEYSRVSSFVVFLPVMQSWTLEKYWV